MEKLLKRNNFKYPKYSIINWNNSKGKRYYGKKISIYQLIM
jgi:hypothetical protein